MTMASDNTPSSDAFGDKPTVYFLERENSNASHRRVNSNASYSSNLLNAAVSQDAEEVCERYCYFFMVSCA